MASSQSKESRIYAELGASSSKDGIHAAIQHEVSPFFVEPIEDVAGDAEYYSILHADGAGTKSIAAYICYRETGNPEFFRGIAQDALVMNLDDVACANAFEGLSLSNTIGRNRALIPDEVIEALIHGYRSVSQWLEKHGINISLAGGETADVGDTVRTVIVDSTLFARVRRDKIIRCDRIQPGDVIIGLSSTGQAVYEDRPNSGIGSNGLTLARHALIQSRYRDKYPEIADPNLASTSVYQGKQDLFEELPLLGENIAQALLSPTRTYAPIIRQICGTLQNDVHGIFHLTGGGQAKPVRFGTKLQYIKDNLFPCPPIFQLIQQNLDVPWQEMYAVFNMGHRMEVVCPASRASEVITASGQFGIEAQQIGRVEASEDGNVVEIRSEYGTFEYR